MTRHEEERAYLLERCLRLEAENRVLRGPRAEQDAWKNELIIGLRGRGLTWGQIGAQMGFSGEAARKRWLRAMALEG